MFSPSANAIDPADDFRLPLDVTPTHYDITIKTDLDALVFSGSVKIDLDINNESSTIVFNAVDLEIGDASIHSDVLNVQQVRSSQTVDLKTKRVTLMFSSTLPAGSKAQLRLAFTGKLNENMVGYYKTTWEEDGKKEYYALTQFEPTDARRVFPCWDEPIFKATFAITMISRMDTVNLSNMSVISEGVYKYDSQDVDSHPLLAKSLSSESASFAVEKWKITKFQTTPPMSTYIVAFANGRFKHLQSWYKSPLSGKLRPLRIYATADVIHQGQLALEVKAKVLPLYEQVFDVEYPLPKLDTLVAHDFDAGAMENWGLITGRTSCFLLDPDRADVTAKKYVVTNQCHEVAHMWFGNITTMSWWDNLYLNEGFATLMGEVIILDKIYPEWRAKSGFITNHLNVALGLDAKHSSHPVEVACPDADDISQIFDGLSYSKAASVLRMLSDYVGEERFLKGVSIYLKKHLYANAITMNLWEAIGEATDSDIPKIMDSWISKVGFPLLTVTEDKDGIRVRQDRFLETGPADEKDNKTIWNIPLSILTVDSNGEVTVDRSPLLNSREQTFPIDTSKPFKLNSGNSGVYRVLYSTERLASIGAEVAKGNTVFSLDDRIGLVHDAFSLAKAGFSNVSNALTFIGTLRDEKDFLVWQCIANNLSQMVSTWWEHQQVVDILHAFIQELFGPLVQRLGFQYSESDTDDITQLRRCAITSAADANSLEVIQQLKINFDYYMKTGDISKIPADLMQATFVSAVRHGGREEYDFVKRIYEVPPNPSTSVSAMRAMSAANDPSLIDETLQYMLTSARDQDAVYYFFALSTNRKSRRLLAKFFQDNYDKIYEKFKGTSSLKYLVSYAFQNFSSDDDIDNINEFFKNKDISKYNMSLQQALDEVHASTAWLKRSTTDILEWAWKTGKRV